MTLSAAQAGHVQSIGTNESRKGQCLMNTVVAVGVAN